MKKTIGILFIVLIALILAGCNQKESSAVMLEQPKPVRVLEVSEEFHPSTLEYMGTVGPQELKKYSFMQPGRLESIYVTEGQRVEKGTVFAQLEKKDYNLALEAALNNLTIAINSYEYLEQEFNKIKLLFEAEAVSQKEYDLIKLELDVSEANLKNSLVAYEEKLNRIEETQLSADMSGYVVDIVHKQGEVVGQAQPIIIVRSETLIVNMSVPQEDVKKVRDAMAHIRVNDQVIFGRVIHIEQLPDAKTRTYNVEVGLTENKDLMLGALATVTIILEEDKGILIPITSIMNKEENFVYVIEDQRAVKKTVELERVIDNNVMVQGLDPGDLLVTEGLKYIIEGDTVSILK